MPGTNRTLHCLPVLLLVIATTSAAGEEDRSDQAVPLGVPSGEPTFHLFVDESELISRTNLEWVQGRPRMGRPVIEPVTALGKAQ